MNKLTLMAWLTLLPLSPSLSGQTIYDYAGNDWLNSRYIVHGDGTVTDTATSLMWRQCITDKDYDANTNSCSGSTTTKVRWHSAIENTNNYSDGTYSDWRLPNIKELQSIVAYDRTDPTVNADIFIDISHMYTSSEIKRYWSSTPRPSSSGDYYSMVVDFSSTTVTNEIRDNSSASYIMVRDAE